MIVPWRVGSRVLPCGARPLVMGVVNVTPDSFYAGSRHADPGAAAAVALRLVAEGADIIDIGGESSRPPVYGEARVVPAAVERQRVEPVVRAVRQQSSVAISVDTTKAEVAQAALDAGAEIVNDISACRADPAMAAAVARAGAAVILMHMRGTPQTMQQDTHYEDLLGEVEAFLRDRIAHSLAAGIPQECIAVDPGLGFGKSVAGNLALLAGLERFGGLGRPVVVGASRKSFIWKTLETGPEEALAGSLAAAVISVLHGAHVLRVHDVAATRHAVRFADAVQRCALAAAGGGGEGT